MSACSSPTSPDTLNFQRLAPTAASFENSSAIADQERLVIRDTAAWISFWTRMNSNSQPEPPRPAVDFSKEMIVAVAMGSRATGGFQITMPAARVEGSALIVEVLSRSPGPSCFVTLAVTHPVDLARVQRFADVRFEERDIVTNCA
jgi:hypothetical protein